MQIILITLAVTIMGVNCFGIIKNALSKENKVVDIWIHGASMVLFALFMKLTATS